MIKVPYYIAIVIIVAFVLNRLPLLMKGKSKKAIYVLFAGYAMVNLGITILIRLAIYLYTRPMRAQIEAAQAAWVPDPTAAWRIGQQGSTWLAFEQGVRGIKLIWIGLNDVNSLLYIIPSCLLNILFFMPLGMLLPCAFQKCRDNRKRCLIIAFLWSLAIEIIQWVTALGMADWKDIVCNTLGAFLGVLIWERFIKKTWMKA
ncbi:MAG: VanZ family protein [Dorea sp.]|nr:VanZ family protein [Dorea sp.]